MTIKYVKLSAGEIIVHEIKVEPEIAEHIKQVIERQGMYIIGVSQ